MAKAKTIGTAGNVAEVSHEKCGKGVARIINGVLHVECVRKGCREWVPLPGWVEARKVMRAFNLILTGRIDLDAVLALSDPLNDYRQIEGLIVIGPAELNRACRGPNGENPLGLKDDWILVPPIPAELDKWIRSCIWRDDKDWNTRAALVLMPPAIWEIPTSLIGQQKIWGVPHDGIGPGVVRQDVFWPNWFVQPNYNWANIPAVTSWQWLLIYEHPLWTTKINWVLQQQAAKERMMPISTVTQDAFALNLVLAATGIRLRSDTWSRTSTIYDGYPLAVSSRADGVRCRQDWSPENAYDSVAASVQGVPLDFGS